MAIALIWLPGVPMAWAQDASDWDAEAHTASRLIAGSIFRTSEAAFLRAGVEIRLDPGWKTYWRYPGDSGVPPSLDFAASENVKSVTMLWPAPKRFADGAGGHSIGYKGEVVLPLRNGPDLEDVPEEVREVMTFHLAATISDVLTPALEGGEGTPAVDRPDAQLGAAT